MACYLVLLSFTVSGSVSDIVFHVFFIWEQWFAAWFTVVFSVVRSAAESV